MHIQSWFRQKRYWSRVGWGGLFLRPWLWNQDQELELQGTRLFLLRLHQMRLPRDGELSTEALRKDLDQVLPPSPLQPHISGKQGHTSTLLYVAVWGEWIVNFLDTGLQGWKAYFLPVSDIKWCSRKKNNIHFWLQVCLSPNLVYIGGNLITNYI